MKTGYINVGKAGPTEDEQRAALRAAGVEEQFTYIDRLPKRRPKPGVDPRAERALAIKALRRGAALVIHSAARLGSTRTDVLEVLEAVGRIGAVVYDCAARETVKPTPEALPVIAFAQRAETQGQQERAAKARGNITHRGVPPPALAGKKLAEAKKLYEGRGATSVATVAKQLGVSERTLFRYAAEKGWKVTDEQ